MANLFRCGSGGSNKDLVERTVWENEDPTASFAAQTITVSEDLTGKEIFIYSKSKNSDVSEDNCTYYMWESSANGLAGTYGSYGFSVRFVTISGTSIAFGDALVAAAKSQIANIPTRIVVRD